MSYVRQITSSPLSPAECYHGNVSLLIPCRNVGDTIGAYFPIFDQLFAHNIVQEFILVDNSTGHHTMATMLAALAQTQHLRAAVCNARENDNLPIKLIDIFDDWVQPLLPGVHLARGVAPGQGSAVYVGCAAATNEILMYTDADFINVSLELFTSILEPFKSRKSAMVRSSFELEDTLSSDPDEVPGTAWCSVVSRLLVKPLLRVLHSQGLVHHLHALRGPISASLAASRQVIHELTFRARYGMAIDHVLQFDQMLQAGTISCVFDVFQGPLIQEGQGWDGKIRISENIIRTLLQKFPGALRSKQMRKSYYNEARQEIVDAVDKRFVRCMTEKLADLAGGQIDDEILLPPLSQSPFYQANQQHIQGWSQAVVRSHFGLQAQAMAVA
jgi:hypothetical protein